MTFLGETWPNIVTQACSFSNSKIGRIDNNQQTRLSSMVLSKYNFSLGGHEASSCIVEASVEILEHELLSVGSSFLWLQHSSNSRLWLMWPVLPISEHPAVSSSLASFYRILSTYILFTNISLFGLSESKNFRYGLAPWSWSRSQSWRWVHVSGLWKRPCNFQQNWNIHSWSLGG